MHNHFWENKNVFITGADGFIGGWLAKKLVEKKANIFVIVRDLKKQNTLDLLNIKKNVTIIQGDIIDLQVLNRIVNEYDIEICFHLAAQAIVGIANQSPLSTFETNIKGTWNVLEACRLHSVDKVIIASSDKAYGVQEDLPYKEDAPLLGLYPYDASKACADVLARCYAKTYGMKIAVTRNANTYGGGDLHFNRIIPDAISSIIKNKPLVIRSDGSPERDYMYIEDAVEAYMLVAENLDREEIMGQAFNFGSGQPVSVIDVFNLITKITGKKTEVKILGEAKKEIDRQYLSVDKVKKLLGWEQKFSLKEGLKKTIQWYEQYFAKNP